MKGQGGADWNVRGPRSIAIDQNAGAIDRVAKYRTTSRGSYGEMGRAADSGLFEISYDGGTKSTDPSTDQRILCIGIAASRPTGKFIARIRDRFGAD